MSSDCSNHEPLLLQLCTQPWAKPRFRFESFWVCLDGFEEVVKQAWDCHLPGADACRVLDHKLRKTAKELKSWSMRNIGSVRSQLFMARELIAQFDAAQEHHAAQAIKAHQLGTSIPGAHDRPTALQAKILGRGGRNTKFFHLQACHRNWKNHIPSILHESAWFSADEAKSELIYSYYNGILGTPFYRQHSIELGDLLPQLDLSSMDACFSEQEVWDTIKEMPPDRAPGPDGFHGLFYKVAWPIIKQDVVNALNALW
ncbi:uncharacterized protein [Miscanthus floridulus]|uniref:uncharacterized protein n=1 Tax=Miscanthus floridulus TaxID=154761 RepID=UPI003458EBBE